MGSSNGAQGPLISQAATTGSHINEHSVQNGRYSPYLVLKRWSLAVLARWSLCESRLNIKKRKKQSVPEKMVVLVRWSFFERSFWPGFTVVT